LEEKIRRTQVNIEKYIAILQCTNEKGESILIEIEWPLQPTNFNGMFENAELLKHVDVEETKDDW